MPIKQETYIVGYAGLKKLKLVAVRTAAEHENSLRLPRKLR